MHIFPTLKDARLPASSGLLPRHVACSRSMRSNSSNFTAWLIYGRWIRTFFLYFFAWLKHIHDEWPKCMWGQQIQTARPPRPCRAFGDGRVGSSENLDRDENITTSSPTLPQPPHLLLPILSPARRQRLGLVIFALDDGGAGVDVSRRWPLAFKPLGVRDVLGLLL